MHPGGVEEVDLELELEDLTYDCVRQSDPQPLTNGNHDVEIDIEEPPPAVAARHVSTTNNATSYSRSQKGFKG